MASLTTTALVLAPLLLPTLALRARFYNTTGCARASEDVRYTFDYLEMNSGPVPVLEGDFDAVKTPESANTCTQIGANIQPPK